MLEIPREGVGKLFRLIEVKLREDHKGEH